MNDEADHHWPYPRWIAHRGAGKLAPENTLAAFRLGAAHGYRAFECDAKLSADGVVFLLHDATLERTSNGSGVAGDLDWDELSRLDAGAWHSRAFAGEPPPSLAAIAAYCQANDFLLNIEIKPTPGHEGQTGREVALAAARLWSFPPDGQAPPEPASAPVIPPLLTSFHPEALESAREAAPQLPRGLLLDSLWTGWLETARSLGCVAVVCNHALWDRATMTLTQSAGLRTLAYTVNDEWAAQRLLTLGIDGIITDRVDLFAPAG